MDSGADSGANGRWFSVYAAGRWNPKSPHVSLGLLRSSAPSFHSAVCSFLEVPAAALSYASCRGGALKAFWAESEYWQYARKNQTTGRKSCFFTGRQRIKKSQSGCHHAGLAFPLLLPLLFPFAVSCKLALFPHFLLHGSLPPLLLRLPAVSCPISACASPVILTRIRLRALFIYSVYVN